MNRREAKELGLEPIMMIHRGPDAVQSYLYVGDEPKGAGCRCETEAWAPPGVVGGGYCDACWLSLSRDEWRVLFGDAAESIWVAVVETLNAKT